MIAEDGFDDHPRDRVITGFVLVEARGGRGPRLGAAGEREIERFQILHAADLAEGFFNAGGGGLMTVIDVAGDPTR